MSHFKFTYPIPYPILCVSHFALYPAIYCLPKYKTLANKPLAGRQISERRKITAGRSLTNRFDRRSHVHTDKQRNIELYLYLQAPVFDDTGNVVDRSPPRSHDVLVVDQVFHTVGGVKLLLLALHATRAKGWHLARRNRTSKGKCGPTPRGSARLGTLMTVGPTDRGDGGQSICTPEISMEQCGWDDGGWQNQI